MARTTNKAESLLTFSRASSGTALTKVAYGPELVTNGNFSDGSTGWTLGTGWSVSGGAATHIGGTPEYLKWSTGIELGKTYEMTVEVTAITGSSASLYIGGSPALLTVTLPGTYTVVGTPPATNLGFAVRGNSSNPADSVTVDNISVKEVFYNDPTGTLKLISHPTNKPRVEYDANGVAKGLLIEEARTNLVTYSQDFNGVAWQLLNSGVGTVPVLTPNYAFSPDGTNNAYRLQASAGGTNFTDYSLLQQTFSNTTISPTSSIWVKSNTGAPQDFYYRIYGTDQTSTFQATTEWQRFSITSPQPNTLYFTIGARGTATGTSAVDILIYGPQLEEGSFPTSYIPTSGATATRSADLAQVSVSEFGYNQSHGSVVVEAEVPADQGSISALLLLGPSTWAGSNANKIYSAASTSRHLRVFNASGTEVVSIDAGETPVGQTFKQAFALGTTNYAAVIDGGSIATSAISHVPANVELMVIGAVARTHIKSIKYYPVRLDDDKLKELTL